MKKKLILFLAVLMLFAIVLPSCQKAPAGANLVLCVGPEPDTIDPALNSAVDGGTMILHAFEGLMALDKDGVPKEAQAKSYTVSADGMTYTFTLRDNLKWSDGSKVVAGDFVYAWNRAVNPDTAADYEYMFEVIAGYDKGTLDIKATDDKTLVVKLTSAAPYFLELCAFPTYYPVQKATIDKGGEAWATEAKTYISNGAYVMKEWVHDSYIIFEKNKNYWNAKAVGPETIKFVLMDDDSAILSAFEDGAILFADTMPNAEIEALKKTEFYFQAGQLGTYYVSYNCNKAPFSDPRVRQALTLAIDRDFIVKKIGQAGQVPAGAYVSIGMADGDPTKEFRAVGGDYYDPNASANAANIAKAKDLLAQAGFPDGKGFPVFEYLYNTSSGHKAMAEALQNMWKTNLNISCELVSQEWNTFLQTRKNGEYQVARNGWLADYNDPISFLDMWITGGGNNDAQWSNKDYDKLISEVKASSDRNVRFTKMHQAEDILFDEWVLCPIYYYVDIFLKSPKLDGFFNSPLGFKNFIYSTVKTDAK